MARFCELISPLGEALLFARMSVTEGLSQLFEIDLVAHSLRGTISGDALLGRPVTVRVTFDERSKRYFNGYVTRFARGAVEGRMHSYRLTVRPWLWFLTKQSDCMVFQSKTVPQVIEEVFAREPTTAIGSGAAGLTGDYAAWDYCVQYRETDFNFVSRLMEQEGIYYCFEHSESDHKLILVDSMGAHRNIEGVDPIDYAPGSVDTARTIDRVVEWSGTEQIEPGVYVLNDYDYERPNLNLGVTRRPARAPRHGRGASEIYDYPGEYDSVAEGEFYVGHRIEELATLTAQFSGSGALRMFEPGRKFHLANHPLRDQNAEYLITSTRYDFYDPPRESGSSQGSSFDCTFTAIRADQQFRPPRITPRPIVQGVQTAFVTGPSGSEIHTDEFGRVKVQFHWDRVGKRDDKSSCWLRVASIAAGSRFGFVAIPRIGQEVVVSFEEGDPDRPLVTGVVYNGLNKPPWELPAKKNLSGFLTRSTTGGQTDEANELRFDDTKGAELLRMHAQRDFESRTESDHTDWIGGKAERYVQLDHIEKIDGERHLTVKKADHVQVAEARHENIGGDEKRDVGGGHHLKIGGDDRREVGGGMSLKVGTDLQAKAGTKFAVDAGTEVHLKSGATLTIEAGAMLTLKVGGNFVSISPAGVIVQGTMVMINSGGAAGSGSGASPMAPAAPKDPRAPGEPPKPDKPKTKPLEPKSYGPRAAALKAAAGSGTPFCEICAETQSTGGAS